MSGTIKSAITALKSRIADAYTAVSAKGGTLPATQDSANLPTAIASIPSGGSPYDSLSQIGFTQADIELLTDGETPTQADLDAALPYVGRSGSGYRGLQVQAYKSLRYIPHYTVTDYYLYQLFWDDFACEIFGGISTTQPITVGNAIAAGNAPALRYFLGDELDLRQCTSIQEIFRGCGALVRIPKIRISSTCSSTYDMYRCFYNCGAIREIDFGDSDTSGATNMEGLFYSCYALKVVKGIIDCTSVLSNRYAIAAGCYNLVEIRFKNVGGNLDLSSSTLLSYDSLLYLVQNLQNVSGKTLTIGTTNKNKLNATADGQAAIAAAQAMGWTIS